MTTPIVPDDRDASADAAPARRVLRIAGLVAVPFAALAIAWWATREPSAPAAAATDHSKMAMGAVSGEARAVTLSPEQARRIGVTYAPVTVESLPRQVRTVGQVTFDETRLQTIAPRIDGWVERLYVDYVGRPVRRGEPLMAIYSPMVVAAQEELLLALRLARDVSGGSADARAGATDLVAAARRRLSLWDIPADEVARVERTGEVQRTLLLRSAAEGIVLEKNVTVGQRVAAGEPLFRIADLSIIWIEGDVYEQDLRVVREGLMTTALFDAYPGEGWSGRIAAVNPVLSPDTRTARVRVSLANPGLRLKPGMFATLFIEGAAGAPVLTVPRGAVLATGEREIVFLRTAGGQLEPRLVRTGATTDARVEILSGLAAGDTVVASATFLVDAESNLGTALGGMGDMPGMEVTMPPTAAPPPARPGAPAPGAPRPAPKPDDGHVHPTPQAR